MGDSGSRIQKRRSLPDRSERADRRLRRDFFSSLEAWRSARSMALTSWVNTKNGDIMMGSSLCLLHRLPPTVPEVSGAAHRNLPVFAAAGEAT
jgi:hypothetical protein